MPELVYKIGVPGTAASVSRHAVCSTGGMKPTVLVVSIALALGTLAGCDRNATPTPATGATPAPASTPAPAGSGSSAQSNTPSTPANAGTPSAAEKQEGSNPTQGQVDPKQKEQHRDFQMKGDGAGPKPGG
ncbi:MAG: hypothetical protein ACREUZ_18930 [Burkholderiales bacterium]